MDKELMELIITVDEYIVISGCDRTKLTDEEWQAITEFCDRRLHGEEFH